MGIKSFLMTCCLFISCSGVYINSVLAEEPIQITIGVTLPLTGSLAHVGNDIKRGMELAVADSENVRIKVLYEDNQHQGARAISAAHKLLEIDRVDILVSLWDMADVVAPLADRKKVPHLSIRWNPHVAERHKYTVTFESTYETYVKSQVELIKALGLKKLGLITEESQGWLLSAEALKKHAPQNDLAVVFDQTFSGQELDFKTITLKLISANPDIVVINAHQPHLDVILKRIREQKPDQKVTGYFEAVEPPSLVEGLPFVAQFEVAPAFSEKFIKAYGEPFKVRAPHGYDLIKIIGGTYAQAGRKLSADEFMQALNKIKNYAGASGTLSINSTKNIENTCIWQIVSSGKFINLSPERLAELKK